jgi:hypothetical protein
VRLRHRTTNEQTTSILNCHLFNCLCNIKWQVDPSDDTASCTYSGDARRGEDLPSLSFFLFFLRLSRRMTRRLYYKKLETLLSSRFTSNYATTLGKRNLFKPPGVFKSEQFHPRFQWLKMIRVRDIYNRGCGRLQRPCHPTRTILTNINRRNMTNARVNIGPQKENNCNITSACRETDKMGQSSNVQCNMGLCGSFSNNIVFLKALGHLKSEHTNNSNKTVAVIILVLLELTVS